MKTTVSEHNDITLIEVSGRMDAVNSGQFEEACKEEINAGKRKIVIDLSEVEYTSSAGLRGILAVAKAAKGKAGVVFCALQPQVAEVFSISGFMAILAVHPGQAEAFAALG